MTDYLLKQGTTRVFIRTRHLAALPDMVAISEEQAQEIISGKPVEPPAPDDDNTAPMPDPPIEGAQKKPTLKDKLKDMDETELRAYAAERKVHVHHAAKASSMRKKLLEVLGPEEEE